MTCLMRTAAITGKPTFGRFEPTVGFCYRLLGGKPIFFYVTLGDLNREISVDVQLPNRERKRILRAKSKFHLVGGREYQRAFRDGNPSWTDVK